MEAIQELALMPHESTIKLAFIVTSVALTPSQGLPYYSND